MILIGYGSFEYQRHCNYVPITNRRHFVVGFISLRVTHSIYLVNLSYPINKK